MPLPFSLAIKYNWVPKTLSLLKINNDFCMSSNIHYLCPYVQVGSKYLSLHFLYKFWCNLWTPRSATINISSMFRSLVHTSTNLIFSKRIKFVFFVCICKRFCQGHLYTFCSTTSRLGIFLADANSWRSTADITIMSCNFQDKHHNYGIFPFQSH